MLKRIPAVRRDGKNEWSKSKKSILNTRKWFDRILSGASGRAPSQSSISGKNGFAAKEGAEGIRENTVERSYNKKKKTVDFLD